MGARLQHLHCSFAYTNQSLAKLGLERIELLNSVPFTSAFHFQPRNDLHASFAMQIAHF